MTYTKQSSKLRSTHLYKIKSSEKPPVLASIKNNYCYRVGQTIKTLLGQNNYFSPTLFKKNGRSTKTLIGVAAYCRDVIDSSRPSYSKIKPRGGGKQPCDLYFLQIARNSEFASLFRFYHYNTIYYEVVV